jgi:hypothetical protein
MHSSLRACLFRQFCDRKKCIGPALPVDGAMRYPSFLAVPPLSRPPLVVTGGEAVGGKVPKLWGRPSITSLDGRIYVYIDDRWAIEVRTGLLYFCEKRRRERRRHHHLFVHMSHAPSETWTAFS